jgi:hypothetical protein
MRWRRALAALLPLLLCQSIALADPSLTLPQYQELLTKVTDRFAAGSRADDLLGADHLTVQTPNGPVQVDLSPLKKAAPAEGLPLAKAYAAAAAAPPSPGADPASRTQLAAILAGQKAQQTWAQWVQEFWRRLFTGKSGDGGIVGIVSDQKTPWVAGLVGIAGFGILVWALWRGLSGHGGGPDLAARTERLARPDRPLTPNERWAEARGLADEGEYAAALRLGHLALLLEFDRVSLLRYGAALTNREHERQLRRKFPELGATLGGLTALVDSRLFGGEAATRADWETASTIINQLWREGDALSRRGDVTPGASSSVPSP